MKIIFIKRILILLTALFVLSCSKKKEDIVIRNVNVIPMTQEIVLEKMSVYISNGKIKDIADYDMLEISKKVKIIEGEGKYLIPGLSDMYVQELTEAELILLLKSGVTTVRNIVGSNDTLLYRRLIDEGKMPGPEIFTTGPILDKNLFMKMDPTGNEYLINIKYIVKQVIDNGYDYIYIDPLMQSEIKNEVINSAEKYGIPILDHYRISNLIDKKRFENNNLVSGTYSKFSYKEFNNRIQSEFDQVTRNDLNPYEILVTSTVNTSIILGITDRKGTIEEGKDADLVLLEKNPLEDIKNTREVAGVMTKGIWYSQDQLTVKLDSIVGWYRE